jgi:hypothetical protein
MPAQVHEVKPIQKRRHLMEKKNGSGAQEKGAFMILVPGKCERILLTQIAGALGLRAQSARGSERHILIEGTEDEVRSAVNESARLGMILEARVIRTLMDLLAENDLPVPREMADDLSVVESNAALAWGEAASA